MSDDLQKQVDIMAEAFVRTFSDGFWAGSAVRHAAFVLEEMRGGRTVEDRLSEARAREELAMTERELERAAQYAADIEDAKDFLKSVGYVVNRPA